MGNAFLCFPIKPPEAILFYLLGTAGQLQSDSVPGPIFSLDSTCRGPCSLPRPKDIMQAHHLGALILPKPGEKKQVHLTPGCVPEGGCCPPRVNLLPQQNCCVQGRGVTGISPCAKPEAREHVHPCCHQRAMALDRTLFRNEYELHVSHSQPRFPNHPLACQL